MSRVSTSLLFLCLSSLLPHTVVAAIPAQKFFKEPATLSIAMSPDGARLAAATGVGPAQGIVIIDAATGSRSDVLALGILRDKEASLSNISWIDSDTIAVQFTEAREGVSNLIDTRTTRSLLVIALKPGLEGQQDVLSVRTSGWLIDALPQQRGQFLYAKSGIRSSLYQLQVGDLALHGKRLGKLDRLDGGQFTPTNRVAEIAGYATRWFLGVNNTPLAVLHYQDENTIALSRLTDEEDTKVVKEWSSNEEESETGDGTSKIVPIAMADQEGFFYALDLAEDEQRSIYKVNYEQDSQELIYETDADQIIDVILDKRGSRMIGAIVLRKGEYHSLYFEEEVASYNSKLTGRDWNLDVIVDEGNDHILHYQQSHNQPGQYYIQDTQDNRTQLVASLYPHLDEQLTSTQLSASVLVEGLEVGYFLNLPQDTYSTPLPLVVIPHGGPFGVFDTGYFDLTAQYFAANGYAVLRVNFRGSGGYGKQLKEAGKGQWGHLMLEDIYQATRATTSRSDIDAQRVCVFGMSYGGYAATSLLLRHPDTYRCGVTVAGVTDLNLLLSRTGLSEKSKQWYRDHVGDPLADYGTLKTVSPVYSIGKLTRPLLVMHGDDDQVVDAEHAWRLKMMMDKHGVDYSWHIFPGTGHHFAEIEETVELFSRVESYIRSHIEDAVAP